MKKLIFFALLLKTAIFANAQSLPVYINYANWPAANQTSVVRFNQQTQQSMITIYDIAAVDQAAFLDNSTLNGTLNGQAINNVRLSDNTYAAYIIKDANTVSLRLDQLLTNMGSTDQLNISFKKNNIVTIYQVVFDASTALPAQLTLDQITAYKKKILLPFFIRKDVGYKARYVKIPNSDQDQGQGEKKATAKVKGEKVTTMTGDQLTEVNNQLVDNYTIHIFYDQYGNNLFGSTPTGISQKYHYMIHILVPTTLANKLHYVLNVTSGSLSDAGSSYNSSVTPPAVGNNPAPQGVALDHNVGNSDVTGIGDFTYNLFPTTDDLIYTITLKADGYPSVNFNKTYTIKKSNFYRGSFDVGVFKTWLNNPTYTLVNSPNPVNTGDQSVKVTSNGANVQATFMYTFYYSIINEFFPNDNNGFHHNSWGRTYLDDEGSIFRKIYPALGVGLNGKVLNNWFVGLNCQPMIGFGFFAGANIRLVNTFDPPAGINSNAVTQDQFNYYTNTKTKSEWAIGIILDTSIFTKIVNSLSASAQ